MTQKRIGPAPAKKIHAYVATPAYDGKVQSDYSQSLAEASYSAPLFNIQVTASVIGNSAFIEMSRNVFCKMFLENHKDCTHLFFIDSDLAFEARAFIGLLQADLPICAGVYRRRQEPEEYPFRGAVNPNGGGLWFVDDWLQCDRVPTGFLCIRRDVIEEMAPEALQANIYGQNGPVPWLFRTQFDEHSRFMGEDFTFCDDYVAKYKRNIPVWTNFNFTHGGYKCNLFDWLTKEHERIERETSSAA